MSKRENKIEFLLLLNVKIKLDSLWVHLEVMLLSLSLQYTNEHL